MSSNRAEPERGGASGERSEPATAGAPLRERLLRRGASALSTTDLLSLALGATTPGSDAGRTAAAIARRLDLETMRSLDADAWRARTGVSRSKAARLAAVFELGRRAHGDDGSASRPRLARPADVWRETRRVARARKEHLVGLYLDTQNGLIHRETISVGSLNTTRSHPREILHPAVVHLAAGFILVHNHPSGCLEPSPEDVEFTRAVRHAAELLGIELYDHLIVAASGYTSLRERGVM